jgi:hypothetical protein
MKGQGGGQVVGLGAGKYVLLPARKPADFMYPWGPPPSPIQLGGGPLLSVNTQSTYIVGDEIGSLCLPTQLEHALQLCT